jgi:hypothetical protein
VPTGTLFTLAADGPSHSSQRSTQPSRRPENQAARQTPDPRTRPPTPRPAFTPARRLSALPPRCPAPRADRRALAWATLAAFSSPRSPGASYGVATLLSSQTPRHPRKRASLREIFSSLSLRLTQIRSRDAGREPDRSPKAKSCPQGKASHLLAPVLETSPRCSERSNSEPTVAHAICRFQPSR